MLNPGKSPDQTLPRRALVFIFFGIKDKVGFIESTISLSRLLKFANLPSVSAPFFEAPGGLEA